MNHNSRESSKMEPEETSSKRDERRAERERRRKEREEQRRKRTEAWKARWDYRLAMVSEKTQLMLAKARRWKWLAGVIGLLAVIAVAIWARMNG